MSRLWRRALLLTGALLWLPLVAAGAPSTSTLTAEQRQQDFDAFCRFVGDSYAYFDAKATDWSRACAELGAAAKAAPDRDAFVGVLERALAQLYDSHAHLGTHTPHSPRLVPTQADVMATWRARQGGGHRGAPGLRRGERRRERRR